MMYADDLILLSETNQGLQEFMDKLSHYCTQWGLTVNINKTKFMVAKSNISLVSKLTYNNEVHVIEQVSSFKYLGIEFVYNGDDSLSKK